MSMEDVVLVATMREEIRDGALRVDVDDIPYHIEMVLAGRRNPPVGSKVYRDKPKSGITGQRSVSTMASVADSKVETEDTQTMLVTPSSGPNLRMTKEGDTGESDASRSVSLH